MAPKNSKPDGFPPIQERPVSALKSFLLNVGGTVFGGWILLNLDRIWSVVTAGAALLFAFASVAVHALMKLFNV